MKATQRAQVAIGLGSNKGQGRRTIAAAWKTIGEHPEVYPLRLSSPYRTEPMDMASSAAPWFTNAVGLMETHLTAYDVLIFLSQVEALFGRKRPQNAPAQIQLKETLTPGSESRRVYQDRTLDLDILLYDQVVLSEPNLIIPHPRLHKRLFVLVPLVEIAAEEKHPFLGDSFSQLLVHLQKTANEVVEKLSW